ncbi:hypothetical protein L1049_002561 [Liquidambar formosana]|uniref:KIB1-4 beta-propeller domain-containing protein n=1 Tax=Liquidambar formosana TaxID=63359 RepID=A0AAP0R7I3_LIQFO
MPIGLSFHLQVNLGWSVDVAVFKGKIYVLTNLGGLGILNLSSHPILTLLKVENTPNLSSDMQLVASDDELLMVDFHAFKQPKVYKLNFLRMEWLKVGNLGDQALFLGDLKCSAIRNPTRWGGRSNCLYHIEFATSTCYSYSLDGEILEIFPIVDKDQARSLWYVSPLWYFPHQCNTVDFLYED